MQTVHYGQPPQRAEHVVLGFPLHAALRPLVSLQA